MNWEYKEGIGLLDYFACIVLMVTNPLCTPQTRAKEAYDVAEAMLKERELRISKINGDEANNG